MPNTNGFAFSSLSVTSPLRLKIFFSTFNSISGCPLLKSSLVIVDLTLNIDQVDMENDRCVQRGSFVIDPGKGAGTDRIEITLKLQPAGWRVASFKQGTDVIEF